MKIQVNYIPGEGLFTEFTEKPERFLILSELMTQGEYNFIAPVCTSINAYTIMEGVIEVSGVVTTTIRSSCSRCLNDFDYPLNRKFKLTFSKETLSESTEKSDEEIEIREEEINTEYYQGDIIDLQDSIQEQVVLAIPPKSLCRDECKGLCSKCGIDLNHNSCDCKIVTGHPAFAALQNLKVVK